MNRIRDQTSQMIICNRFLEKSTDMLSTMVYESAQSARHVLEHKPNHDYCLSLILLILNILVLSLNLFWTNI